MNLIVDVDGVLLDWLAGFKVFLNESGIEVEGDGPSTWSMNEWIGVDDYLPLVREFNSRPAFGSLSAIRNSQLSMMAAIRSGFEIHAISSSVSEESAVGARESNLKHVFGDIFKSITCLPLGESKEEALREHYKGSYYVEDNPEHALVGVNVGLKVFLMDRTHNREFSHPDIIRYEGWSEIWRGIREDIVKEREIHYENNTVKA